jgi:hypothetical protein
MPFGTRPLGFYQGVFLETVVLSSSHEYGVKRILKRAEGEVHKSKTPQARLRKFALMERA